MDDLPKMLSDLYLQDDSLDEPDIGDNEDIDSIDTAHSNSDSDLDSDASGGPPPSSSRDSPCRNRTKAYRDYHTARPGSLAACAHCSSICANLR